MGNQQMAYSSNHQPPIADDANEWHDSVSEVEEQKRSVNNPESNVVVNGILDEFIDTLFESKLPSGRSEVLTNQLPDEQQRHQTTPVTYGEVAPNWKRGADMPPESDRPTPPLPTSKCPDHPCQSDHVPRKDEDMPTQNELKSCTDTLNTLQQEKENETYSKGSNLCGAKGPPLPQPAADGGPSNSKELCFRSDPVVTLPCPEDCVLREPTVNDTIKAFELSPRDVQTINQSGKFREVARDCGKTDSFHLPLETADKCVNKFNEDVPQDIEDIEALNTSTIIREGEAVLEKTTSYLEYIARQELEARDRPKLSTDAHKAANMIEEIRKAVTSGEGRPNFANSKKEDATRIPEVVGSFDSSVTSDTSHSTSHLNAEILKSNKQENNKGTLVDSIVVAKQLLKKLSEEQNIDPSCNVTPRPETPQNDLMPTPRPSEEVPSVADIGYSLDKESMQKTPNSIRDAEGKSDAISPEKENTIRIQEIGLLGSSEGLEELQNWDVTNVTVASPSPSINNVSALLEENQERQCNLKLDANSVLPAKELSSCDLGNSSPTESKQDDTVFKGSQQKESNLRPLAVTPEPQRTNLETTAPATKDIEEYSTLEPWDNLNKNVSESLTVLSSGDDPTNISSKFLVEDSTLICESSATEPLNQNFNNESAPLNQNFNDESPPPNQNFNAESAPLNQNFNDQSAVTIPSPEGKILGHMPLTEKQEEGYNSKESVVTCEKYPLETADHALNDSKEITASIPTSTITNTPVDRNAALLLSVEENHSESVFESTLSNLLNQNFDATSLTEHSVKTVHCDEADSIPSMKEFSSYKTDNVNLASPVDFDHNASEDNNQEISKLDSFNRFPIETQVRCHGSEGMTLSNELGGCAIPPQLTETPSYVEEANQEEGAEANSIEKMDSIGETSVISSSCFAEFVPKSGTLKDGVTDTSLSEKRSDLDCKTEKCIDSQKDNNTSVLVDEIVGVPTPLVKDKTSSVDDDLANIQKDVDNCTVNLRGAKSAKSLVVKEEGSNCQNVTKDKKLSETRSQRGVNNTASGSIISGASSTQKGSLSARTNKQQRQSASPRKPSVDAATAVKQKSPSPEAASQGEVKQSDKSAKEEEFVDALMHLPKEHHHKKTPKLSSAIPQVAIAPLAIPPGKRDKVRPPGKEQVERKETRRQSTATCSQMEKPDDVPFPREVTRGSLDATVLSESPRAHDSPYKGANVYDLDEVINQFRHKQKSVATEDTGSNSNLEGKGGTADTLQKRKSIPEKRRHSVKGAVEYNREKKLPEARCENIEGIVYTCSGGRVTPAEVDAQNSGNALHPREDAVDFRGAAYEQKKVDSVRKDGSAEKNDATALSGVETKKARMPELKPETLKSLIADLSLQKSTVDVGCNTEEWTRKDSGKAEWLAERKKLIGRIADLHQTQSATKFIVKELIFLVTSWMEGKDKDNVELQETRQKLMNERDQALEDLRSVEESFYELHRRYEKIKKLTEDYKKNEEILRRQISDGEEKLHQQKQMFDQLVKHSEEKLEQANAGILNVGKSKESEVAVLTAQLRKAEMKATSLEKALEQKVRENTELSSICEDLINKCGKK